MHLNAAVIGYGFSAKTFHIPFLLHDPAFYLYSIVQRTPRGGDSAISDFPDAKAYRDAYAAIQDENVDILVITSTNDMHYPLTKAALENGKHVIVEKPFTITFDEAKGLVDLADKSGLTLAVYHNRRWDSDFLTLCSLINDGSQPLGDIICLRSHFDCAPNSRTAVESKKWRLASGVPGAGMLFDLGSHLIDQAIVLLGRPRTVTCMLFDEGGRKDISDADFMDDGFLVVLGYGNGLKVELHSTQYCVRDRQKRFEVLGTKGRWVKYGLDCQEEQLQKGIYPGQEEYGVEKAGNQGLLQVVDGDSIQTQEWESARGGYQHFYRNVHDAITGQAELSVKPTDAAFVMYMIELCRKSAVEGRTLEVEAIL